MDSFQCENCGAEVERRIRSSKLVACTHCDTTLMLVDDVFRKAGEQGVMQDAPSLLKLGERVNIAGGTVTPVGQARFSYGRGWWDEFWCDADGEMIWVSVDEGDYAVERPMDKDRQPRRFAGKLGGQVTISGVKFTVTEAETGECIGLRGEFPEELRIGEKHLFYDLTGPRGELVTVEEWDDERTWFIGNWVDPWRIGEAKA